MSDGISVDVTTTAHWTTGDATYATISQTGLLQSVALGGTDVRAVSGGFSGVANVTIVDAALDRIDVTPIGVRLPIGLVQAYEATGTFSDGSLRDVTGNVAWDSSASSVASISGGGVATGLSARAHQRHRFAPGHQREHRARRHRRLRHLHQREPGERPTARRRARALRRHRAPL